jgi:ribosome-binding protein aMBF1 (putative translation factor)
MIENQLQYRVTKAKLQDLLSAQKALEQDGITGKALAVRQAALKSLTEELQLELLAFENLKSQALPNTLKQLEQVAEDLIKARVARGYTQAQLAAKLNLKPQQIQRYEASRYASASLARVLEVARVLQQ